MRSGFALLMFRVEGHPEDTHTNIQTCTCNTYVCIYIYMCVCVCVCICVYKYICIYIYVHYVYRVFKLRVASPSIPVTPSLPHLDSVSTV